MLAGAIVITILLVAGAIALFLWPKFASRNEEKNFLGRVYHNVYEIAKDRDFYVINDVAIEIDSKIIHFNHILFGDKYIYCIGDSYQDGALSGKFVDPQWIRYPENGDIVHIKNPMTLHQTRVRYLKSALSAEDLLVGICVVNDSCEIEEITDAPEDVVILNEGYLRRYISEREKENISSIDAIQMDKLVHTIYERNIQTHELEATRAQEQ